MAGAPFQHRAQVRFSDTDAMGHVNHARLLAYLEDARIALLREAFQGQPAPLWERGIILARLEIDYLRPVPAEAGWIDVPVWVKHIGRSSFTLAYSVRQGGDEVARASTVLVAYDYASASTRLLSESDRLALERMQVAGSTEPDGGR
jgi:acyl-CoA thioester hydrolase